MLTPKQRAVDAQVGLYGAIAAAFRNRDEIADALCAVVETGRLAHGDVGIKVSHGYKSLRTANHELWNAIESSVWTAVYAGHAPGGIWGEVKTQLKKIGLEVADIHDIATAHAKKQSDAA